LVLVRGGTADGPGARLQERWGLVDNRRSDARHTRPGHHPTPTPNPTPTLYSWANPISGVGNIVDHTWVTSFPAASQCPPPQNYWYSWGGCHETGPGTAAKPLATHAADLAVAKCICTPDLGEYLPPDSPSHGGINLYGIDGVCHQLSNRILWAATLGAGAPVTVDGAKGYGVSRWLYGTYGGNVADWQQRIAHCTAAAAAAPAAPPGTPVATAMMAHVPQTLDADLAAMIREKLGPEFPNERAARLVQIRNRVLEEKRTLDRRVQAGMPPRQFAESVNDLVDRGLHQVAQVLTPAEYLKLFGLPPGERIGVVDPAIAEQSIYRGE
jgi:hypothetical protein